MSRSFQRRIENFRCEHCGQEVVGNGYTNHCPNCLWSKHVDVNPGDREAACGGLMEPIGYETRNGAGYLTQRCVRCGHERKNKLGDADNRDALLRLMRSQVKRLSQGDR